MIHSGRASGSEENNGATSALRSDHLSDKCSHGMTNQDRGLFEVSGVDVAAYDVDVVLKRKLVDSSLRVRAMCRQSGAVDNMSTAFQEFAKRRRHAAATPHSVDKYNVGEKRRPPIAVVTKAMR